MDFIKIYYEEYFTEMGGGDKIILVLVRDRRQYLRKIIKKV